MAKRSNRTATGTAKRSQSLRAKAALPTVTAEKVLEGRSRAIFAECVSPWLVTTWAEHDYGIDAIVEITRARESGRNFDATGKRFAVQLKATEEEVVGRDTAPVRVRAEHIRYWLESSEPVLLVRCHVPSRQLLWRWIDHSVVDELNHRDPAWIGQETVTVGLATTQILDEAARRLLAKFVTGYRVSARRVLAPGTYTALQTRLSAVASSLTKHAKDAGFQSVTTRLADLEASVRGSTYVVALTGPARVGKSTLLNALIGREISPVGRLPTTAVSLIVMAGVRDEAEVVFVDDARVSGDATSAFLEEYATQENNPDNHKRVRMIAVRLVNERLERGVAYADAPGLHDPSEEIRLVTESALKAAHAVMYVFDVSPARLGGFSLSSHQIEDLKRLREMADRLFVILNKADALGDDDREDVAQYVERTLRKYSIWDSLPAPPLFVSATEGWKWQQSGRNGESPLAALDDAIWTHLLRTNSTGLDRLAAAATELRRAGDDFASILASRRISGEEASLLSAALDDCRSTERSLVGRCRQRLVLDEQVVATRLLGARETLIRNLKARLDAVPVEQALPASGQIERELQTRVAKLQHEVWVEITARSQTFASSVGHDIENSLQQARLATQSRDQATFLLPAVPALNVARDSFEEAWTGMFAGGFFALLIGSPWGAALAVGGWLAGLALGRERRRKREIARIVERAGASLTPVIAAAVSQVHDRLRVYMRSLERQVTDRISVFVHDVEGQLKKLETPITRAEARRLEGHEQAVRATLVVLQDVGVQLEGSVHAAPMTSATAQSAGPDRRER